MMEDRTNWRPTTASTAVVVFGTLVTATVLVRAIGVAMPAALGGVGALALALVVWTAGWERRESIGTALSSLLALPVGVGLVAATAGTVIVLSGVLFPVSSLSQLPTRIIELVARAMVVVGAVAAVFGATVAVGNVLDRATAKRAAGNAFKTTVLPLAVGLLLSVRAVLSYLESTQAAPGIGAVIGDVLRAITTVFFEPATARPRLTTFLLLVGTALLLVRRAIWALPLTELTTDDQAGDAIRSVRGWLARFVLLAGLGIPVGFILDYLVPPERLLALTGPAAFEILVGVTTTPLPRRLAWWTILVCVATLVLVALLRRVAQASADRIGAALAPFAAGGAILLGTTVVAAPVLATAREWIADTLPGEFGPTFRELSGAVVEFYGPLAIVTTAVGVVLLVATVATTVLWIALLTKYLEDRTAGVGIASVALFQMAAFAGLVGISTTVLLGSLVAAVLVWDVGEFGTTLGEEIGRAADTRRTELIHTTGTFAVGGIGAGVALAVQEYTVGAITVADGTVVLGLAAVLAGLLSLLVALR